MAGAFSFKVCIKNYYTPPSVISFVGNFDYFAAIKPTRYEDLMGTVLAFKITDNVDDIKVPTEVKTAIGTIGVMEAVPTLGVSIFVGSSAAVIVNIMEGLTHFKVIFPMFFINMVMVVFITIIFKKLLALIEGVVNEFDIGSAIGSGQGSLSELAQSWVSKATGKADEKITSLAKSWGAKKEEKKDTKRPDVGSSDKLRPDGTLAPDKNTPQKPESSSESGMPDEQSQNNPNENNDKTEGEKNTPDEGKSDALDDSGQEEDLQDSKGEDAEDKSQPSSSPATNSDVSLPGSSEKPASGSGQSGEAGGSETSNNPKKGKSSQVQVRFHMMKALQGQLLHL